MSIRIEKKHLFRMFYVSLGICAVAELLVLRSHPHVFFWWQEIPDFYAFTGFLSCILLILIAKGLGHWLKKEEDYYEKLLMRGDEQ